MQCNWDVSDLNFIDIQCSIRDGKSLHIFIAHSPDAGKGALHVEVTEDDVTMVKPYGAIKNHPLVSHVDKELKQRYNTDLSGLVKKIPVFIEELEQRIQEIENIQPDLSINYGSKPRKPSIVEKIVYKTLSAVAEFVAFLSFFVGAISNGISALVLYVNMDEIKTNLVTQRYYCEIVSEMHREALNEIEKQ